MSSESKEQIREAVRQFIISEFLPTEDPSLLTDDTKLITGGIMDSIATVRLVAYLEERFGFELQSHDVTVSRFDTIERIIGTVEEKRGMGS
jgi:acyl carrier protein